MSMKDFIFELCQNVKLVRGCGFQDTVYRTHTTQSKMIGATARQPPHTSRPGDHFDTKEEFKSATLSTPRTGDARVSQASVLTSSLILGRERSA
jgi:hypothetical protein